MVYFLLRASRSLTRALTYFPPAATSASARSSTAAAPSGQTAPPPPGVGHLGLDEVEVGLFPGGGGALSLPPMRLPAQLHGSVA